MPRWVLRCLGSPKKSGSKIPFARYGQIHPEDKHRWSLDAAQMCLTGEPLKSAYRVIARDGRVL
jgi:hypothetical protein